jgi:hypothetical protein
LEALTSIPDLPTNGASPFDSIRGNLRHIYSSDRRPWLVGFSGSKDSTMLASLIFETVLALPYAAYEDRFRYGFRGKTPLPLG